MFTDAVSQVHWPAVVAAVAAHFVLGGVWFVVWFGKSYAEALGIADRPPAPPAPLFVVGPLVCSAVNIVTTALLQAALRVTTYGEALALGAVVGFGYLAAMTVNIAINPLFPRPFRYALVSAPMFVLGSLMSSVVLVALS